MKKITKIKDNVAALIAYEFQLVRILSIILLVQLLDKTVPVGYILKITEVFTGRNVGDVTTQQLLIMFHNTPVGTERLTLLRALISVAEGCKPSTHSFTYSRIISTHSYPELRIESEDYSVSFFSKPLPIKDKETIVIELRHGNSSKERFELKLKNGLFKLKQSKGVISEERKKLISLINFYLGS